MPNLQDFFNYAEQMEKAVALLQGIDRSKTSFTIDHSSVHVEYSITEDLTHKILTIQRQQDYTYHIFLNMTLIEELKVKSEDVVEERSRFEALAEEDASDVPF